ncbi:hepatitis A virus cellular receptor 1 homolog [Rana temporaria]|uniref:hepatitis A virus cellular receptor 1 homolog n=1 Tax=Rana temporaria TaxID=8407 RepID=UPI001AAD294F|nr:hepatitis A virus cellular receptor 1 homolog [Rana temporaria]
MTDQCAAHSRVRYHSYHTMSLHTLRLSLLLLFIPAVTSNDHVRGSVYDTVTLPCNYDISGGTTTMCWGKGLCPMFKCSDIIIETDGSKVTKRVSDRYQLLGAIAQGNVSLTISNLTEEDEGWYCCRVEMPGWFNDLKKEKYLRIQDVEECPDDLELST